MSDFESLVRRTVVDADLAAWRDLQAALQPMIEAIARRHPALRRTGLAALPDDVAEVKLATLERFARSNFENLKRYLERNRESPVRPQSFDAWVYGAVDFTIREHVRRRFGRAPKLDVTDGGVRPSKRELNSHAARLDDVEVARSFLESVSMTAKLTVGEIFAHIEREFAPDEARAMKLYYGEDRGFDEIARMLSLSEDKSAERMIRRLNARLRYHFMPPEPEREAGES